MTDDEANAADVPSGEAPDQLGASNPESALRSLGERAERGSTRRDAQIESLKSEIKGLQGERKTLDSIAGTAAGVMQCVVEERWCGALRQLRGAKKFRDQLAEFDTTALGSVDAIELWLESQARDAVAALPRTLIAALGDELPDPESRSPRFVFRKSFLTVEINRTKFEATAATRASRTIKIDADAATIAEHVNAELARCFDRKADLDKFAGQLHKAYLKTDAGQRNEPAGIREVADQLGDDVRLDEFSVDIARLLASADGSVPGAQGLRLDHTKNTDQGLLLPGHEESGYFGSISYRTRPDDPKDEPC